MTMITKVLYTFKHRGNVFSVARGVDDVVFRLNDQEYVTTDLAILDALDDFDGSAIAFQEIPGWDMLIDDARRLMSKTLLQAIDTEYNFLKEIPNPHFNPSDELAIFFQTAGYDTADTLLTITGTEE